MAMPLIPGQRGGALVLTCNTYTECAPPTDVIVGSFSEAEAGVESFVGTVVLQQMNGKLHQ